MSRKRWLSLCHHLVLAILLVGLLTAIFPVSTVKADAAVSFPDPCLEAAIRAAIGPANYDVPILRSRLEDWYGALDAEFCRSIVNLSGIEYCINLSGLWLAVNQISDISLLSSLTNLTQLGLQNNQISDISPLSSLTNLTRLYLQNNQISDIERLVNNPGLGSGDELDVRGNPLNSESVDTHIPALIARGVDVKWDSTTTITGYVEDGYEHKLGGVEVTLIAVSSGSSTTAAVTITDDTGEYSFGPPTDTIQPGTYQIEVALECHETVGDTAIFSINYDTEPSVRAQTDTFYVPAGEFAKDIGFDDPSLIPPAGIPQDRLADLAGMYYHVKQAVDFSLQELGVTLDLSLPIEVRAYRPRTAGVFYSGGEISVGDAVSGYNDADRPMNREWHETFHELMDDTVVIPPYHTGDTNHDGFKNHCTGDSLAEGWAEFWSCALKGHLGSVDWRVYEWAGGNTNLEYIWTTWDDEEFAVASLLVDLADPVDPADGDYVSLTNSQLWAIIGSQSLADMSGVYGAMVSANVGQLDTDTDNITDLDELFITHGFFADDGNQQYDGEAVGLGGKAGRTDRVPIPGASIRVVVADSQGNPVSSGTLLVNVTYPSPLDIYNYSYEVTLAGSDSEVGLYVAPEGDDALMTMRVRDGSGALSDELVVSNSVYWDRVSQATEGYAAEHTFVIGAEGKMTTVGASAATSGGVPVWIWPIVGMVAVAAGAGGLLLLRRRAKSG